MKFLRHTNSNLSTCDRNRPFFAVEVSLQRSVTYNVPSQPTFLACIPLPGRINITVNVYMRTALCATVSPTLPLRPLSLPPFFFLFLRTSYSEFPSPFLTFSALAVNHLVSPSFASLIQPPLSYIIPRAGRGREISTYICAKWTSVVVVDDTSLKRRADDFPSVRPPPCTGGRLYLCPWIKTTYTTSLGSLLSRIYPTEW